MSESLDVIVFQNPNGPNVCVCYPVSVPCSELIKNQPDGIIMCKENLPSDEFFDAWRISNGVISIDLAASKIISLERLNSWAMSVAQKRSANTSIGLPNAISDVDFVATINNLRTMINDANDVDTLKQIVDNSKNLIQ